MEGHGLVREPICDATVGRCVNQTFLAGGERPLSKLDRIVGHLERFEPTDALPRYLTELGSC
jgi:hypothetical protein